MMKVDIEHFSYRLEKKLDGNYTRMLRAILNKSWQQHPTRHQLYGHLPPITKTIQVRRTRHAGHCWRSRDETHKRCTLMDPHTWPHKSRTTSSNVHSAAMWGYRLFVLKTYLGQWTIGRSGGERGSGISVLPARYDDDDDNNLLQDFKFMKSLIKIVMDIWWKSRRNESNYMLWIFPFIHTFISMLYKIFI